MSENENVKINENVKENGKKVFGVLLVLIVSATVLLVLIKLLFVNGKINQGKFRVMDTLVVSSAEFVDKSKETGSWTYDVSQTNLLSLLINTSGAEVARVYITDAASQQKNIQIRQKDFETNITCNEKEILELFSNIAEDGSVVYDIEIVNKNVLENFEVPEDVTEITHDASIFRLAGLDNSDLTFSVSFVLNAQETNGKVSSMKINLEFPCNNIVENGVCVEKLDLQKFVFRTN